MAVKYEAWERCDENMSGIHTWVLVDNKVKEGRKVVNNREPRCHRCNAAVPPRHRDRIRLMLIAHEAEMQEAEARRKRLKEVMRHAG